MKYAAIVPLIGGMILGSMKNLNGKLPEFILSYPGFQANDGEFLFNYPKMKNKYFIINEDGTFQKEEDEIKFIKLNKNIDFVVALPPCAGLSQLNSSKSNGQVVNSCMARGSDAIQNRFMYLTTEFAILKIKPKFFIFENAPALYTESGKGVFDNLTEIAKKYNHSFTCIKTSTVFHGIPQARTRSFGIIWNSKYAPIVEWIDKPRTILSEFLKRVEPNSLYHDNKIEYSTSIWKEFFDYLKTNPKEIYDSGNKASIFAYIFSNDDSIYNSAIEFFKDKNESIYKGLLYAKNKLNMNKGFWDSSPIFVRESVGAIISKNMFRNILVDEERYLTFREHMNLMGLPDNFNLTSLKMAHTITQNVPVDTAADYIEQGIKFINGKLKMSDAQCIKQNNTNKSIEFYNKENKFAKLENNNGL